MTDIVGGWLGCVRVSCSPPGRVEHLPRAILVHCRRLRWCFHPPNSAPLCAERASLSTFERLLCHADFSLLCPIQEAAGTKKQWTKCWATINKKPESWWLNHWHQLGFFVLMTRSYVLLKCWQILLICNWIGCCCCFPLALWWKEQRVLEEFSLMLN